MEQRNLAQQILMSSWVPFMLPALGWVIAWNTQVLLTDLVYIPDYLSVVYFTSGVQICSALLFGIRGVGGSWIGSVGAFSFLPSAHYPASVFELSVLTLSLSVIAILSVAILRRIRSLNENFDGVTVRDLFFIVLLYNALSSVAHYLWTSVVSKDLHLPYEYVILGFISRVVGSFIVMYTFLAIFQFLIRKKV